MGLSMNRGLQPRLEYPELVPVMLLQEDHLLQIGKLLSRDSCCLEPIEVDSCSYIDAAVVLSIPDDLIVSRLLNPCRQRCYFLAKEVIDLQVDDRLFGQRVLYPGFRVERIRIVLAQSKHC